MSAQEKSYESEHTRFIRELLARRPEIAEDQREGRALWWDKELDRDEQQRYRDSRIPQAPYVYQSKV